MNSTATRSRPHQARRISQSPQPNAQLKRRVVAGALLAAILGMALVQSELIRDVAFAVALALVAPSALVAALAWGSERPATGRASRTSLSGHVQSVAADLGSRLDRAGSATQLGPDDEQVIGRKTGVRI